MKAILTYDLSDPDDIHNHLLAVKSIDMSIVLFEIIHNLRKKCEYICDEQKKGDMYDGVEIVFNEIWELLNENNISGDLVS